MRLFGNQQLHLRRMGAGSGVILSPTGLGAAGLSQGTGEMGHAMGKCVALSPQQAFEHVNTCHMFGWVRCCPGGQG